MHHTSVITLLNPNRLVFGTNCFDQFIQDYLELGLKRLFVLSFTGLEGQLAKKMEKLDAAGIVIKQNTSIAKEPSFEDFEEILEEARAFKADSVVGIGGGSILDVAKLVAAQLLNTQSTTTVIGKGNLAERATYLACIPTTSGTGSEVSPNAIFVDANGNKVGVISPFLVPDAAYIDPVLTVSVPKAITAATGIDALTHCLEAYANKFSHPVTDLIALEGISLVAKYLKRACDDGTDLEARSQVALGSMYGGMCLGPVNTAAVHALAYPLGVKFHINHGLSIALLLPAVMEFTLSAAPERYSAIAIALGAEPKSTALETARAGVELLKRLIRDCGLPASLAEVNVPFSAIEAMAIDAVKIERLLKNNLREVALEDAKEIYKSAF
ncbi:iron-containing alcohol dehydrogenase [Pedobacter heparinus]|uniref:Iron-containing alcohol dehydrogenase n=1 Tax=Pedobacter heparinus (strain ATCC 13125 / DSM 2366 / CIP 104194 / JCM 7457 / NBRC 12017 / NCIMB 9290 / NRRL B-14731 / HIM 762-3) TaxID=485917 RepID=C6Y0I4_PEDHD|nr:iron-containing alcohol dehydrogenase [Pedobacter heparinus]ACU02745.1 iron-containing alcohol dehydrogenase [Pedobacter heparinus DSM 2366]